MRTGGLALVLWLALALVPVACSGDDEPESSATSPGSTTSDTSEGSTGEALETERAATSTQPAEGEQADPSVIGEAAAKTREAKTARVATLVRVVEAGGQQRFGGQGKFDFERRAGEMTLELIEGENAGFGSSKAVFVDSTVYYQLPVGALGGGKRWIQLDLQNVADASGLDFGPLVQGSQADPTQYLLWLSALGPEITKIGEEDVRGAPTSRYRAIVDLNALEAQAPPGKENEWAAYVQTLRERLGLASIPVEVWVDGEGLIRRFNHEYGFSAEGTTAVVTMELFDFGIPVDVAAPPPGQVVTMTDLTRP